jgi:PPOX class probable F420-dependent enzyme
LFVMTRSDSGKAKRLRNNPKVDIAPSTMRGKRTGAAMEAVAKVTEDATTARRAIRKKYLLARLPIWSRQNIYLEIRPE